MPIRIPLSNYPGILRSCLGFVTKVLILALPVVIGMRWPPSLAAQESGVNEYLVTAGAYKLGVTDNTSSISVGRVAYTVTVREADSGRPVADARVVIRTKREADDREGWATALNSPIAPERYDTELRLDSPGVWKIIIEVDSSLGKVEAEIPSLEVPRARRNTAGGIVFVAVFLILALGVGYVWWSTNRTRRRLAEARSSTQERQHDNLPGPE